MPCPKTPPLSERKSMREAYIRHGKLPLGTLLRLGLRDLLIQPFWLPWKYMPGAVGMKVRQWIYRCRLARMGHGSLIEVGAEIVTPQNVWVGSFTLIDKYCQLHASEGSITIGDRCHIAPFATIFGHGDVVIEDYVGIASGAKIFSISEWPGDGKRLCGPMIPLEHRGLRKAPVTIKRDVLIGAHVVVMPGITIGEGAVVGSNSVVTHDIPPWTIAVGAPARPVAKRDPVNVQDLPKDPGATEEWVNRITAVEAPAQIEEPATIPQIDSGVSSPTCSQRVQVQWNDKDKSTIENLAASWFIPRKPVPKTGWLTFSLDFTLAALQGCIADPRLIRHGLGWRIVAYIVRVFQAIAQALVMVLSIVPVTSCLMEIVARIFTRNAVGFFLRSCYWKTRLKRLGTDTLIDQGVEIWGASNVSIGSNCHIDTNVRLAAGERRLGQRGLIAIGDFVHLGPGVHIAGRGGVEIRDCVGIMANAHLYSATGAVQRPDHPDRLISMSHMAPREQQHVVEGPILVDHYAFVGMMSRVMPNVTIGFGAIVHANCELTRDVPCFANFGGIPRGRQIGWRKPRRPSPNPKQDQLDSESNH